MPVEDVPVHPKTISSARYEACQLKKRQPKYFVLVRHYFPDGRYELRNDEVIDTTSLRCRYTRQAIDPKCEGCDQPIDHDFIKRELTLK